VSKPAAAKCKTRNKPTGVIKYSDWQFPDTLNPYQTNASVSFETIYAFWDKLIQFNQNGAPFAVVLAKLPSVKNGEITNGGKTVNAVLRKGLRWSNNQEIVAQDVKFTWQMEMNKDSGPACSGTCDVISSITVHGKYNLTFHLKSVAAPFITNDLPDLWPHVWPGAWGNNDVAGGINKLWKDSTFNFEGPNFPTDGPYQVQTFDKDNRIVLKPMKYYNTLGCGGRVSQLIFAFYASKPGLIAAAANRETDTTTNYTLADIPALNANKTRYHVNNKPGYLIEHLTFNLDPQLNGKPNPLANVKVRQALALGLNKYALLESALSMNKAQASGIIAWTPLILTKQLVQPFADKQLKGQYDPITKKFTADTGGTKADADAKTLLKQAGYPNGFSVDGITTQGNPVRVAQFNIVLASWKKIGVTFNPNYEPSTKLFGEWADGGTLQHGDFSVAMYADVGYPDPDGFKQNFQHQFIDREKTVHSSVNANVAGIKDPQIDQAFNKAFKTLDPAVRQKWYNVWQVRLNQQAYWIPLFYRGEINTDDGRIGNFTSNPTNAGNQWNVYKWFLKGSS
jgi:peptide/nickel transport system substrate-binding protein